jgi:PAS domain S-box-containing protein
MMDNRWVKNHPAAITVCDREGIILSMNDKSIEVFAKYGGRDLIGKNLLNCHPQPSRDKLAGMLEHQTLNCYTTEESGIKNLIYQSPWYENGRYMGFVEMIIELPENVPNYIRKP